MGILLNFFVEFIITQSTIYSLRTLHEKMILKLLRAPINLFHDIYIFSFDLTKTFIFSFNEIVIVLILPNSTKNIKLLFISSIIGGLLL